MKKKRRKFPLFRAWRQRSVSHVDRLTAESHGFTKVEAINLEDYTSLLRCHVPKLDGRRPRFTRVAIRVGDNYLDIYRAFADVMLFAYDNDVRGLKFNYALNCYGQLMFIWVAVHNFGEKRENLVSDLDWKKNIWAVKADSHWPAHVKHWK